MRMHRGSSKGARLHDRPPETLPLSASPPTLDVVVEVTRAGRTTRHLVQLAPGASVRDALRAVKEAPEGCAVLDNARPMPLDEPIAGPCTLTVIPTFSGG